MGWGRKERRRDPRTVLQGKVCLCKETNVQGSKMNLVGKSPRLAGATELGGRCDSIGMREIKVCIRNTARGWMKRNDLARICC